MTVVIPTQTPSARRLIRNNKTALASIVGAGAAAILIVFVPKHEGTVLKTYPDPAHGWAVPTACVGHTGPHLKRGQTFTPPECATMLEADLIKHAAGVRACVTVPLSAGEAAAYTSFAFNVGVRAFCQSTMARLLNAGKRPEACAQLSRWVNAAGKPMRGLVIRRAEERRLCEGGLK